MNVKNIIRLLLLAGIFFLTSSASLYSQYLVDRWTTADGLPQNSVNAIIQTRDGYLWIGTYGGLARFDGINFARIDDNKGLNSNRILALSESHDGGIWIGTEGGGVAKYKDGVFTNYGKENGLRDEVVFDIREDKDSLIWIGTRNGFQCLRNGKVCPHIDENQFKNIPVRSFFITNKGDIYINSDNGIYRIAKNYIKPINIKKSNLPPSYLFEDKDGGEWLRLPNGLENRSKATTRVITFRDGLQEDFITQFSCDKDGVYWVGTITKGVSYGKLKLSKKLTRLQLVEDEKDLKIQKIFIDQEGNRWIGTDGEGLFRIKDRIIDVIGSKEGLNHSIIEGVFEDSKKNLWICTNDGGLYKRTKNKWHRFTEKEGIDSRYVWSVAEDKSGAIWAGSYGGGLFRYQNGKFINYTTANGLNHNVVLAIYCDKSGSIWIGTENGGVNILRDGKFYSISEKDGLSNSSVRTFLEDQNGGMWIGTIDGLNYYKAGKIKVFSTQDGLSHNYVRSIYEDAEGVLWIGTYGGGLNRYKEGKFTKIKMENGLFDNIVSAILEDEKQNFWMSCNRGIYRVSRHELNDFADGKINSILSIAYGTADGMLSEETNGGFQPAAWKTSNGELLFPTIKGLALIYPERIKENTEPPIVHIEKILVEQIEVPIKTQIEVPFDKQQIEIHYTALYYSDPKHITFEYKLTGIDGKWINVGNRRAVYFWDLSPGKYEFEVKAINKYGIVNKERKSIRIIIAPPIWKTWYFILFVIGSFALSVFFLMRRRELRRRHEALLHKKYTHQLLDTMELERKRIASELHDSIGQELLIIKNRAMLALEDLKNKKNVKEELEEISEAASQAIQETREISYNLRPYQIDRLGLTKSIESLIKRASQAANVNFELNMENIDNVISKEMEIHFYRIIQECINNIIKHSGANNCKVTIKHWHERINIDIEDNGRGFDIESESKSPQGYGIQGIMERTQFLGGKVRVESAPEKGTRILLTFVTNEKSNGEK